MKIKYFISFIALSYSTLISAQCHCGSASLFMLGESGCSTGLKKNSFVLETTSEYRHFHSPHSETVETHTHHHSSSAPHSHGTEDSSSVQLKGSLIITPGIRYGITDRITISVQVPYMFMTADTKNTNGCGDAFSLLMYKFINRSRFSASLIGGIKLPTGIKSVIGNESTSMIGSGSYDPIAGINLVYSSEQFLLRGNAIYKHAGKGFDQTYYGNFSSQSLAFSYRITKAEVCTSDSVIKNKFSCSLFSSLTGEYYGKQIINHIITEDSGGYLGLLAAGVQLDFGKWSFPLSASVNIYNHMRSEENKNTFRLRATIIRSF